MFLRSSNRLGKHRALRYLPWALDSSAQAFARVVVYAGQGTQMTAERQAAMLAQCRSSGDASENGPRKFWLADIPVSDAYVPCGTPFCSVYFPVNAVWDAGSLYDEFAPVFTMDACKSLDQTRKRIQENIEVLT